MVAKKVFKVEVCDVCGTTVDVHTFRISERGDGSVQVSLCEDRDHGGPRLRALMQAARNNRPEPARGQRARVFTMEEVAAARRPQYENAARAPRKRR